jgi:hypothetical protein
MQSGNSLLVSPRAVDQWLQGDPRGLPVAEVAEALSV